uniref:Uncharacterized protein n=1 Tax=Plectus sambesii TaxID=2011161 RepID=A0A914WRU0_9BILA
MDDLGGSLGGVGTHVLRNLAWIAGSLLEGFTIETQTTYAGCLAALKMDDLGGKSSRRQYSRLTVPGVDSRFSPGRDYNRNTNVLRGLLGGVENGRLRRQIFAASVLTSYGTRRGQQVLSWKGLQ